MSNSAGPVRSTNNSQHNALVYSFDGRAFNRRRLAAGRQAKWRSSDVGRIATALRNANKKTAAYPSTFRIWKITPLRGSDFVVKGPW